MALRFRRSKKILPGVRLNLNKNSISVSLGPKGFKHTISSSGRKTTTLGIPGSGLSYSSISSSRDRNNIEPGALFGVQSAERPTSSKSKGVALILCIFLGYFGAHRFYVGKIGTGLIWAFTGGVFGIGWIIDIFTVALNGFYDNNGFVVRSGEPSVISEPRRKQLSMVDVEYSSPSGGYVNYSRFRATGINPETGRKNTKIVEAKDEDEARYRVKQDGLVEPITIDIEMMREPTERQMEYALGLGLDIPQGACFEDVSAMIDRVEFDDESSPDWDFAIYANDVGIYFSRLIGHDALIGRVYSSVSEKERAALYTYAVFLSITGGEDISDIRRMSECNAFYHFAEKAINDPKMIDYINSRDVSGLLQPNKTSNAYKSAISFLRNSQMMNDLRWQ